MMNLEFSEPDQHGIKRAKLFFDNGYGLSIISSSNEDTRGFYLDEENPYECAVLVGDEIKWTLAFNYEKKIDLRDEEDGDWPVFGWCNKDYVNDLISGVQSLDKLTE
jgi:hypothetical protein